MKAPTTMVAAVALCASTAAFAQDDVPDAFDDTSEGFQEDMQELDEELDETVDETVDESVDEAMQEADDELDSQPREPVEMEQPPAPAPDVDVYVAPPAAAPVAAEPMEAAPPIATRDQNIANRFTDLGGELKVGAGGGDYTEDTAQDLTGAAFNWDVRGVFANDFPIGLEAAYVGSSRNISNSFANGNGDTQLVSNGAEGNLRLGLPISAGDLLDIRPFAFGGVGWQYMTMWGDGAVDGARDDGDHILTIPAGLGLDVGVGPLNLDVRGTYRHAVGSDLFGDASAAFDDDDALHTLGVTGAIGIEF